MKKFFAAMFLFLFLFSLTSCADKVAQKTAFCDAYIKMVEKLLEEDPALNENMKYIAIEMKTLQGINSTDEAEIAKYLGGKYAEVRNASLEDLKRDGEFDETNLYLKNGVAIKIDKMTEFSEDRLSFEASKYKSGLGAIGLRFNFTKGPAGWEMGEVGMAWIS